MAPRSIYADIDPFADNVDGDTSIGAGAREIVDIGSDEDEWGDEEFIEEFDEVSGVEIIGLAQRDLIGASRVGADMLDSDEFLDTIGKYNHKKVAKGIRSVTRSPVTHAAIGAVATMVPYGTVAAGIAEVGIGIAEGFAAIGGGIAKVVDKLNPFKKNPKRRARRKKRKASRREKRRSRKARKGKKIPSRLLKGGGAFSTKKSSRGADLAQQALSKALAARGRPPITVRGSSGGPMMASRSPSRSAKKPGASRILSSIHRATGTTSTAALKAKLSKMRKLPKRVQRQGKAAAQIRALSGELEKRVKKVDAKAGKSLASTMRAAKQGSKKAKAALVGIQFMTNPAMVKAKVYAQGIARGLSKEDALKLGNAAGRKMAARMRNITKEARKHPTGKKRPGVKIPDSKKVRRTIEGGARILMKKADEAARKRSKSGNLPGIAVTLKGRKIKGTFVNKGPKSKVTKGWVVTKSGKALPGRWARG